MKLMFTVGAILFALISAGLWFWSAKLRPVYPTGYLSGPPQDIVDTVNLQSKLNAWAAAATGLSVLCQSALAFLDSINHAS
jgi:hypothetical protein